MQLTLSLFCILICFNLQSQPCPKYDKALNLGKDALKKENYQEALNQFQDAQLAARECPKIANEPAAAQIQEVFKKIEGEKNKTKKAFDIAEKERKNAVSARTETEHALAKAAKLINAFYFWEGRFALAQDQSTEKFHYINKEGDNISTLKEWDKAEQFDEDGFAKVWIDTQKLIIDTFGNQFIIQNEGSTDKNFTFYSSEKSKINYIPGEIFNNSQLKVLRSTYNKVDTISNRIGDLKDLEKLILHNNNIKTIPGTINKLVHLKILNLSNNMISVVPKEVGDLTSLNILDLSKNKIVKLKIENANLKSLYDAELQYNLIEEIPQQLFELRTLRQLDLSNNKIKAVPPKMGNLVNLETLFLNSNTLDTLPKEIGRLKKLKFLDIRYNNILNFPDSLTKCQELRYLNIDNNLITTLPHQIKNLKNLQEFHASDNRIVSFLPGEVGELVNLKTLKINGNQFVDLPSDFEKLIRLEKLDLGDNQLTTFPEFIVKMKNLKELILENNPGIKTIPVGIFELRKLVYFSLKGTSVKLKEIENLKANLPPDCIIDF